MSSQDFLVLRKSCSCSKRLSMNGNNDIQRGKLPRVKPRLRSFKSRGQGSHGGSNAYINAAARESLPHWRPVVNLGTLHLSPSCFHDPHGNYCRIIRGFSDSRGDCAYRLAFPIRTFPAVSDNKSVFGIVRTLLPLFLEIEGLSKRRRVRAPSAPN